MKYFILLTCLGVCFVSLPVTLHVVADHPATEPDASTAAARDVAAELQQTDNKVAEKESTDADKNSTDAKSDDKASKDASADKSADKTKTESDKDDKDAAAKKEESKADDAKDEKKKKKERKTYKVKEKRLKVDVSLDGAFVADKMTEVALRPKEWSQFEIVEIVKHGSEVHEGETLIKFDNEKINKDIADLELEQRLSEISIRKTEEELPRLEKTLTLNAADAERTDKNAKEDYERYHKIDRPMIVKSVEYMVKYAQFTLDYEQDELDQLQKMYEADDLTEETEEIILKRQRNSVDFAKFNMEQAKQYRDDILDIRLPRHDIEIKQLLDRAALDLARANTALALDLNRARYELEQLKRTRTKSLDRHAKLLRDRDLMEIKAPADGVVYYGESDDGRWADTASLIDKLKPHNSVSADTVLMTIVEQRPVHILAQVGEEKRPDLAAGQQSKIVLPNDGADRIPAKVKTISTVPVASGKFDVAFDLASGDLPEWLVAGTSCKVKVTTYDKDATLVVPKKALHPDDYDDEQQYVWIVDPDDKDAKPERRNVKLGKRSGDDVEVLKGLKADNVISLEDEKDDGDKEKED